MIRKQTHQTLLKRWIIYPMEGLLLWMVLTVFRLLPLAHASRFGAMFFSRLGPYTRKHKVMLKNFSLAFPHMTDGEKNGLSNKVWQNLGQIFAETQHLPSLVKGVVIEGLEHIPVDTSRAYQPCLFLAGHIANWEIVPGALNHCGLPFVSVYRAANNPIADAIIMKARRAVSDDFVPKGSYGARLLIKAIKDRKHIGMLVDQKMNDGISVPFFGHPAMTAPAIAALSLKHQMPIIPLRVYRDGISRYRIKIFPALNGGETVEEIMARANQMLEDWIRETPDQWLWTHNRWPRTTA